MLFQLRAKEKGHFFSEFESHFPSDGRKKALIIVRNSGFNKLRRGLSPQRRTKNLLKKKSKIEEVPCICAGKKQEN
jgi:hypothetical protein